MQAAIDVLLVEDDPLTAFTTARSLRKSGVVGHVTVATDGREAFDLLMSGKLDGSQTFLILTDLSMPRMSGLELAAAIRAEPTLRDHTVVVLTTSIDSADREAAEALGVAGFFLKSHGVPHLAELLAWMRTFQRRPN